MIIVRGKTFVMNQKKINEMSSSDIKEAVNVASNGIYNLSPDKEKVMAEVYRVLKPGGRTVFSEIVLKDKLSEDIRNNINDLFRCVGRALPEKDFLVIMEKTGFKNTEVISKIRNARTGHKLALCANIRSHKI